MASPLIIALDFNNQSKALQLIDQVDPQKSALKIGSEMFTLFGPDFIKIVMARGFKVFLDLKFHDIPNTVAHACKAAADLGVWMMNVHASGGIEMMIAARKALESSDGSQKPLLIAVTVLTSMDEEQLIQIGINTAVEKQVSRLVELTYKAGLDGVVCSAQEASLVKKIGGTSFLAVTPGIRLQNNSKDDQVRILTPGQAVKSGSDYLVVGRPITQAINPAQVIEQILSEV